MILAAAVILLVIVIQEVRLYFEKEKRQKFEEIAKSLHSEDGWPND